MSLPLRSLCCRCAHWLMLAAAWPAIAGPGFSEHVQPILERKCVACHACFDAPCQLILTHPDGLRRGANKQPVYAPVRLKPGQPTRLHTDAHSVSGWRALGFFSVLGADGDGRDSLLSAMISHRTATGLDAGQRLPEDIETGINRNNFCARPDEIDLFRKTHPHAGMPFAAPPLSEEESAVIRQWLDAGAEIDYQPRPLSLELQRDVARWETLLNHEDDRYRLVARWLFEHLYMAHLYFEDTDRGRFFRLVRSRTAPGKPVSVIATRRPNDDPVGDPVDDDTGGRFYYRLQPIDDSIVFKTHITLPLSNSLMRRIDELFFAGDWSTDGVPAYGSAQRTNPFRTFAAIPAAARYRFMLEHLEFFIRTFIRGPVCHGQIATDVIRDRFWVLFQDPDADLYITDAGYRERVTPLLDITGIDNDLLEGATTWVRIRKNYYEYNSQRRSAYESADTAHASLDAVWDAVQGGSDRLTVFRHFDNASVVAGFVGDTPLTAWWMDFPLLERGYYNLVVNFDVFGSIAHQAQTRFYFDLIRNDAERNFLRLMPRDTREDMLDDWYQSIAQFKLLTSYMNVSVKSRTGVEFDSDEPKRELLARIADTDEQPCDDEDADAFCRLSSITARRAAVFDAVRYFPEVSIIRVADRVFTLTRNRAHSNVAFLFGEDLRWQPDRDSLSLLEGVVASYPNFIFDVPDAELDAFIAALESVDGEADFRSNIVERWGVRRTDERFWQVFHELDAWLREHRPVEAGILDMRRYSNL